MFVAVPFSWITDQSVRSSYQPMTSLAQLHDCHSCYDERSIDQQKKKCECSSSTAVSGCGNSTHLADYISVVYTLRLFLNVGLDGVQTGNRRLLEDFGRNA